jgi:tRNA/rRNA methyltransferase
MNLGQAVAVCLYELAGRPLQPERSAPAGVEHVPAAGSGLGAPSGSLELLAGLVEETMEAADYSPRTMQAANRHDLRLLLRRLALNAHDIRRVLGIFRRILWRLKRSGQRKAVGE